MKAFPYDPTKEIAGMNLRDWFAGLAMQGIKISYKATPIDSVAKLAYQYADAMMQAREKKDEQQNEKTEAK